MAIRLLTLVGGHQAVFRRVSDLQRDYASVIGELAKGHTVVIQRNDEMVGVLVDPVVYNQLIRDSSRTAELDREVEHWKAMYDLACAGGPSLAEVRRDAAAGKTTPLAEARKRLLDADPTP
jgi:hypothetical protein